MPINNTGAMPSRSNDNRAGSLIIAGLLAAPLAAGAFVSSDWTWGWDHLHRAAVLWPLLLVTLLAAASLPPVARRFLLLWDGLGDWFSRHGLSAPLVMALLSLAAFMAFPIATRLYGDSLAMLNHHTGPDAVLHLKRIMSLSVETRGSAVALLHHLCELATGLSYERCYLLLSALSGGIFVFAHLRLAATLPGLAGWARLAIAWLGLTDGANQLFFGHIELYTVPRLVACLFLIMVTRSVAADDYRPRRVAPHVLLALAIFLHLQWVALLPAGLLLLGRDLARKRPRLRAWTSGRAAVIAMAAAMAIVATVYAMSGATCYDYLYTGGRPQLQQMFLPLSTACIGLPYLRYTMFSWQHLLDLAGSLYSVSSPAILLVIVLLLPRHRRAGAMIVILPALTAALAHNLVLNPSIGLPFDWDLMSVVSPPLLYTAVCLLALAGRTDAAVSATHASSATGAAPSTFRVPVWIIPLFLLGLATATVFAVNASEKAAYRRVEDMAVWLHRSYYGNSHYRLSANLSTIDDPAEQDRERARVLERLGPQTYPDDREVAFLWERLARMRMERQEYRTALEAYHRALAVEPSRWPRKRTIGWLETVVGDEQAGLALLAEYLRRAPTDAPIWLHLGHVHMRRAEYQAARRSWERYLQFDPDGPEADRVRQELRGLPAAPGL